MYFICVYMHCIYALLIYNVYYLEVILLGILLGGLYFFCYLQVEKYFFHLPDNINQQNNAIIFWCGCFK